MDWSAFSYVPAGDGRGDLPHPHAAAGGHPRPGAQRPFLQSFLYYVPYAVLGAMTFPAVFSATGSLAASALAGALVALVLGWMAKGSAHGGRRGLRGGVCGRASAARCEVAKESRMRVLHFSGIA